MLRLEHLGQLIDSYGDLLDLRVREFSLGGRHFDFNSRPGLMGVINLSPDSWYRESVCLTTEAAVRRAKVLVLQGADIVDVGAESSLAQAEKASACLQHSRLLPVIKELAGAGIPVSAETYDPEVAEACLEAGARVINLTGVEFSRKIYRLAREHDAGVIICYVQGPNVREVVDFKASDDPVELMSEYFERESRAALDEGLEKIILDPGLGFYYRNLADSAQRVQYQMRVFLNTFRLRRLGFPVCHALPHAFEYFGEEVRTSEVFFAVLAVLGQTDLFRTHEVARIRAVLETMRTF
jgi:dihydropteroate synthase